MRNLVEQLLSHKAVPPALRQAARRANAARDQAKMAEHGRTIVKMLLARGDLVKVKLKGASSQSQSIYAFRGHSTVMDLGPMFADTPEKKPIQQPKKSNPVLPSQNAEIMESPTAPEAVSEPMGHEQLISAMESAQRLQTEDVRTGGVTSLLEELLEMLERYLPEKFLFMEMKIPDDPYHQSRRVFLSPEGNRPFWSKSRVPGEAVWIDSHAELPEFLRKRLGVESGQLDSTGTVMPVFISGVVVPVYAPARLDAQPDEFLEAGLLYLTASFKVERENLLRLANRLSRFVNSSWRQKQQMHSLVHTDALTGIRNRSFFDNQFKLELERARRAESRLVLVVGDIDHFKIINDTYGHQIGDLALKAVARELLQGLRRIDIVCRIGGEEFALILPDTGLDDARDVVSRIQGRIADIRLSVPDVSDPVGITISFGGVNYPDCGNTSEELFRKADKMLYLSKERGRNRCHFWNSDGEPMLSLPNDTHPDQTDTRSQT